MHQDCEEKHSSITGRGVKRAVGGNVSTYYGGCIQTNSQNDAPSNFVSVELDLWEEFEVDLMVCLVLKEMMEHVLEQVLKQVMKGILNGLDKALKKILEEEMKYVLWLVLKE